jgi:hypothetical protein
LGGDDTEALAKRYLAAAGAAPIAITERDGAASLSIGLGRATATATTTFWADGDQAADLARHARQIAGNNASVERLTAALREAAADRRLALTPHADAIARAKLTAARN